MFLKIHQRCVFSPKVWKYLDSDTIFIILALHATTTDLKWNNLNGFEVQNFSFNLTVFTSKLEDWFRNCENVHTKSPISREVIGQMNMIINKMFITDILLRIQAMSAWSVEPMETPGLLSQYVLHHCTSALWSAIQSTSLNLAECEQTACSYWLHEAAFVFCLIINKH